VDSHSLRDLRDRSDRCSGVFFYEGPSGHCEFHRWNEQGALEHHSSHDPNPVNGLPAAATQVIAGYFGSGTGLSDLVFLNGNSLPRGHLAFRQCPTMTPFDDLVPAASGIRPTAGVLIPGNFYMADPEDNWFQDGPLVPGQQDLEEERVEGLALGEVPLERSQTS
jgi:hypothetical protein